MKPAPNGRKQNKSYFLATLALLLTLCISITGLIWLHTNRTTPSINPQPELSEHIGQLHAKVAMQQKELWELRARLHNLEKFLQDKFSPSKP